MKSYTMELVIPKDPEPEKLRIHRPVVSTKVVITEDDGSQTVQCLKFELSI